MDSLARALSEAPALQAKYAAFFRATHTEAQVSTTLLALCRARIELIHGLDPQAQALLDQIEAPAKVREALQSGQFEQLDPQAQAALTVAEQIPFNHHAVSDSQIAAVANHLGDAGAVSLLTACAFYDVNARLSMVLAATDTHPG